MGYPLCEDYLFPVIDHLHKELLSRTLIHGDESSPQVLKENGKKPQTKSHMWLYHTGNAANYLSGFKGYLHADGYSGYNRLSHLTRCGCWGHLRRKFVETIPPKKAAGAQWTTAEISRDYCNELFYLEDVLNDIFPEERQLKRLELKKPFMENYLLDGRRSLANNAAENAIHPFTVGHKNWLFADTPKGAKASDAVYSIVETAKANNLNVKAYLEYLLQYMPSANWQGH